MPVKRAIISNLVPVYILDEIKKHKKFYKAKLCICKNEKGKCSDLICYNKDHMLECSKECGKFCENQRLRKGVIKAPVRKVKLNDEVGSAVRATKKIWQGTPICEYYGELKSTSRYESEHRKAPDRKIYAMEAFPGYVLDAGNFECIGKYINHACTTNCTPIPMLVDDIPRILITATRDILPNEYLTYNYNMQPFKGMRSFVCKCGKTDCVDKAVLKIERLKTSFMSNHKINWVCTECKKEFANKSNLSRHMFIHKSESEKPFPCTVCNKRFRYPSYLKEHLQTHSARRDYFKCPLCECKYTKKVLRDQHVQDHCEGIIPKQFPCAICNRMFFNRKELKKHKSTHQENKQRKFECLLCNIKFASAEGLKMHRRTHEKKLTLSCHICKKKFQWKSDIKLHLIRDHKDFRPYACHLCGRSFQKQYGLTKHIKDAHQSIKPTCNICNMSFYNIDSLKRHEKLHAPENKSVKCPLISEELKLCNASYNSFESLMRNHIHKLH